MKANVFSNPSVFPEKNERFSHSFETHETLELKNIFRAISNPLYLRDT